ncbi:MAG: hypothetical protein JNK10_06605 [Cyclobacteriaceae bacterium]|nr:hypothetical protein [Cyclobacteriaceae bacterium]
MTSEQNIFLFISGFGIIQAVILAGILYFHPRADRRVNSFLALYITLLSVTMFLRLMQYTVSWQSLSALQTLPLLTPPALYFYVRSFREPITWRIAWPHLILFLLYFLHYIWRIATNDGPGNAGIESALQNPVSIVKSVVRMIQAIGYYFLARRELKAYQTSINNLYSETSRITLSWVSWLIHGNLFIVVAVSLMYFVMMRLPESIMILVTIRVVLLTLFIYGATFLGITQPTVWQLHPEQKGKPLEDPPPRPEASSATVEKSARDDEKLNQLATQATALMEGEKIFREPELTLQQLADRLQAPAYQVSQAINEAMRKSF